jgi:hypothetical protein
MPPSTRDVEEAEGVGACEARDEAARQAVDQESPSVDHSGGTAQNLGPVLRQPGQGIERGCRVRGLAAPIPDPLAAEARRQVVDLASRALVEPEDRRDESPPLRVQQREALALMSDGERDDALRAERLGDLAQRIAEGPPPVLGILLEMARPRVAQGISRPRLEKLAAVAGKADRLDGGRRGIDPDDDVAHGHLTPRRSESGNRPGRGAGGSA